MIRGIQSAIRGMQAEQARVDAIANNIANIDTNGYKSSVVTTTEFGALLVSTQGKPDQPDPREIGLVSGGAEVAAVVTNNAQGDLVPTGNPLDVAIMGPGSFTYQGPNGLGLTRAGNFHRDDQGFLVTQEGYRVLAGGLPIGAGAGTLEIQNGGTVLLDGKPAGTIDIQGADPSTQVLVKNLERSNVDLANEMTDMIIAMRSFQAIQRALSIQDQTLGKAVTEIAKV